MNFKAIKSQLEQRLTTIGVASPEAECRLILEHLGRRPYFELALAGNGDLSAEQTAELTQILRRRATREPLQHILGHAWFRDLDLYVSPDVLIPRPETEILVDILLDLLPPHGSLLDLGTGSGAIALSVAKERPDASVCAADISPAALNVARRNAAKYQLQGVEFIESDLFAQLSDRRFHVIAANLPYVSEAEYLTLEPELQYDPKTALTAPDAGFALIAATVEQLHAHLVPQGQAIFELSPPQAPRLVQLLQTYGFRGTIRRDLTGRDRFVVAE